MPRNRRELAAQRKLQFEQFEQRLVMSAQAIAPAIVDALPELEIAAPSLTAQDVVWQQSNSDQNATNAAADLAAQYGLDGSGQTVAVIDSGIAWDHHAFGNGFGAGHQVVGGWDFAENDANPYDDGPAGYHGTHVAGIIGSQDDQYRGVSSGVDLVSLRVFDDQGAGNLDWVEEALQWVSDHQYDFENPITTVNLSMGTGWNPETTPGWGQLEDEFSLLKDKGIFISVAAGNSFAQILDQGLSYPAASEHVVPVASHGPDGQLSDFSQRDSNVLVAPGEMLRSAVPDHLFGGTAGDQFLASSGTSMAAPYVAGASTLLREANLFMGNTNVDQDLIYEQLLDTADRIFDSVTGENYFRINLSQALEHVISDKYADSLSEATNLGELNQHDSIQGTIGNLMDVDAVKFIATETGKLTLTFDATHELAPEIEMRGENLALVGNQISFDVVAGQEYGFLLGTSVGTGHYEITLDYSTSGLPPVQLGAGAELSIAESTVDGTRDFLWQAHRSGILTVNAEAQQGGLTIQVLDSAGSVVDGTHISTGRIDVNVEQGQQYRVRVTSNLDSVDFDLRLTNLISLDNEQLTIAGTNQSDNFTLTQDSAFFRATINGVEYSFDLNSISRVAVDGLGGSDTITVDLADSNDNVATRQGGFYIGNENLVFTGNRLENTSIDAGDGFDRVLLKDSAGQDWLTSNQFAEDGQRWTRLAGQGYQNNVAGFEIVHVRSQDGTPLDQAVIVGSTGDDVFGSRGFKNTLRTDGMTLIVDGFQSVDAYGGGGTDRANLMGSTGDDQYTVGPRSGSWASSERQVSATGFAQVNAISTGGNDQLVATDSVHDDSLLIGNDRAIVAGENFGIFARGFGNIEFQSQGGWDVVQLHGTMGNDLFTATTNSASLISGDLNVRLEGVENVALIGGQGGRDQATVIGSAAADHVLSNDQTTRVSSDQHVTRIQDIESIDLDLLGGEDTIDLIGSLERDNLTIGDLDAEFESTARTIRMSNFEQLNFDGQTGNDSVELEGTIDLLTALGDHAEAVMDTHKTSLENFKFLEANQVDQALANYEINDVDFIYMLKGRWNH